MRKSNPNAHPLRRMCQFLSQFFDKRNYWTGVYQPDGSKKWTPSVTNAEAVNWQKCRGMTHSHLAEHFAGQAHHGYNNNPSRKQQYILVNLDPDSHDGDWDRARKLALFQQRCEKAFGHKIYFEDSTSGKDKHGYIIIYVGDNNAASRNAVMRSLEPVVNAIALSCGLKQGEIKGYCPTYKYDDQRRVIDRHMPSPAKCVRDYERVDELENSHVYDISEIRKIVADFGEGKVLMNERSGGSWYKGVTEVLNKISTDLTNVGFKTRKLTKDRNLYSGHLATYTAILYILKKNKIDSPALNLVKWHWQKMKELGLVELSWNKEIAIACNKILSLEYGMLNWIDNRYSPSAYNEDGEEVVKGKACRFELVEQVFSVLLSVSKSRGGINGHGIFSQQYFGQRLRPVLDPRARFLFAKRLAA